MDSGTTPIVWVDCPDPVRKGCGWWEGCAKAPCVVSFDSVVAGPALVEVPLDRLPGPWPAGVRAQVQAAPEAIPEFPEASGAWTLLLSPFVAGQNDDVGLLSEGLARAHAAGCDLVQCCAPEADFAYKYRVLTLVRSLCDEQGLRFSVLERPGTPLAERLNRYLCSQKPCCRAFP